MDEIGRGPINPIYMSVDASQVPEDKRAVFLRRRLAVRMRLDGESMNDIFSQTEIIASEVNRLIKRFKTKNENGVCFGDAACIPGFRVKTYERKKPIQPKKTEQKGGMAGAMYMLLEKFPAILPQFIEKILRQDAPIGKGMKYQKSLLFQNFYEICRDVGVGVGENDWPFCQPRGANKTISGLINKVLEQNFQAGALAVGGRLSLIHTAVCNGIESLFGQCDVLDVLEIDSHFLDGKFVLKINGDRRLTTDDIIDRFWLICARCRRSKAVCAARYVFSSQVTALDVFQVICDAYLGIWKPRVKFSITDLSYVEGAGMPYYVFPGLRYHSIAAIYFDNAMQHFAKDVQSLCLDKLGIAIDYGPLGNPGRRTNIEGLFNTLASHVLHPLSSTTGRHPYDGRSDAPEKAAIYYDINVDEALEVLDVYIANYNATPGGGANKGNSPLGAIKAYMDCEMLFKPIVNAALVNSKDVNLLCRKVFVRGSIKNGIRPRIKLDKALYTSPILAEMPSLIGQEIIVRIDPNDYRTVTAYLLSGLPLDVLTVELAWREYKHSVQTRKLINRAVSKKLFEIRRGQRPVVVYQKHLLKTSTARNNLELQRLLAECPELSRAAGCVEQSQARNVKCSDESVEVIDAPKWRSLPIFNFEG